MTSPRKLLPPPLVGEGWDGGTSVKANPPPPSCPIRGEEANFISLAYAAEPPAALPPLKTSGHLTIGKIKHELYQASNLDFKWNLTDVTPDLSRVGGSANLRQGKGLIQNAEKLANRSKVIRIALYPLITLQNLDKNGLLQSLHLPTLQSIPFDSIKGDYAMKSGLMNIQTFELAGHDLALQTHGTEALSGEQLLDLKVIMKLAAGAMGSVGQLVQDENGRPTITFSVTGPSAHPSIKLALPDVEKKALQQAGQQFLNSLGGLFH